MNPDVQAVLIRQISGAVNGRQFRVQDLEEAVRVLQEPLNTPRQRAGRTASWLRSSRIDRIQVCGAMLAPDGESPLGIVVIGNIKSREETRSKRHCYWNRPPQSNKSAAVLATIKGKSFRDGLRPPLTAAARQRPRKIRSGRGDGRRQIEQGDGIDSSRDTNRPIQVTGRFTPGKLPKEETLN